MVMGAVRSGAVKIKRFLVITIMSHLLALVSESTGDYMWSASCTEGIWQGVCVLSIKAPLAKVEDILPDVFIILQAFPSGCGTHSSYLCNIALCKMITDVVWLYSNISPFRWIIMEEYNLGDTCTVLLNVTLNYRYRHIEWKTLWECVSLACFWGLQRLCVKLLLFPNTLTSTVFTATKVFWLLDSPYFFHVWYLYICVIFRL